MFAADTEWMAPVVGDLVVPATPDDMLVVFGNCSLVTYCYYCIDGGGDDDADGGSVWLKTRSSMLSVVLVSTYATVQRIQPHHLQNCW